MDNLIKALSEVSSLLLPVAGLVCLIILGLILFKILQVVKELPTTIKKVDDTIEKVDDTIDSVNDRINQLQGPLNTLNNVSNTVDAVNAGAVGFVSKVTESAIKNSDAVFSFVKGFTQKHKEDREERKEKRQMKKEQRQSERELRKYEKEINAIVDELPEEVYADVEVEVEDNE